MLTVLRKFTLQINEEIFTAMLSLRGCKLHLAVFLERKNFKSISAFT